MKETDIKKISEAFAIPIESLKETLSKAASSGKNQQAKKDKGGNLHSIYFLSEDIVLLDKKIENLHHEIDRLGKAIGRSCDVSGETFHDNFDYEECSRQQAMWSEEIKKLTALKQRAKVVKPSDSGDIVAIGRKVTIVNEKKVMTLKIGSYMTFNSESVSYASPIVRLIFGAKVGDIKEGLIRGQKTKVKILDIN